MQFLFLIIGAVILMFGPFSCRTENYYCETFYTAHTEESAHYKDRNIKSINMDTTNANIFIEAADYDDGVVQVCGKKFEENFTVSKVDDTLYIKSKDASCDNCEITIVLPMYYHNNISFNINSKNGNLTFSDKVNVEEIFCNILNGDVLGGSLTANTADIKTDEAHNQSFKELILKR